MRGLILTTEWPSTEYPNAGIFVFRQVKALDRLGVELDVFPFRGKSSPALYALTFLRMYQRILRVKYDFLHAHFGQAGFLATLQMRLPAIVTFHGSDLYGLDDASLRGKCRSSILKMVSRFSAKKATEVIIVSERLAFLLPKRRYRLIPMAIDLDSFRPMPRDDARRYLKWPISGKIVLFVGDPKNPIKRYWLAKESVSKVARSLPDIQLRICTGVRIEEVPYYMNAADVLIVTSSHEAGPLVVREAVACNLPVVSVNVGDVRERIAGIRNCVVCDGTGPSEIARELISVLQSPDRANGRESVAHLTEEVVARELLNLYSKVLQRARQYKLGV